MNLHTSHRNPSAEAAIADAVSRKEPERFDEHCGPFIYPNNICPTCKEPCGFDLNTCKLVCPKCEPLADPASRKIAAHTTPGSGESELDLEIRQLETLARRVMRKMGEQLEQSWLSITFESESISGTYQPTARMVVYATPVVCQTASNLPRAWRIVRELVAEQKAGDK